MNHYAYESYLEHSGKKGMHWGVWKERSAKYEHGMMKGSGKRGGSSKKKYKRTVVDRMKSAHYTRKRKQRLAEYNKRREAETKKQMTRDQLIESGNAKLVRANKDKLSTQELKRAIDRIETEQKLDRITSQAAYDRGVKAADRVIDGMVKADKAIRAGSALYNDVATLYNAGNHAKIATGEKKPLPMAPKFKQPKEKNNDNKNKGGSKGKTTNININL